MNGRKYKNISPLAAGLIVICLLVTGGCRKKTEPAPPPAVPTTEVSQADSAAARADDEKTVRRLANEFITAFHLDSPVPTAIARLEEIFADNICQITMAGKVIQGKQNNLLFYRNAWQKRQANLRVFTKRYDIQSVKISRDLAVVSGKVEGEGRRKNAPEPFGIGFMETLVFQKINGKWRLVQEHSTGIKKRRQREDSNDEKPAAEETSRTKKHISSPYIGFGVGTKRASDNGNKPPPISDSNDKEQKEAVNLSPEQTKHLEEHISGSFSGIGVEIGTNPDGIYIENVIPGGPADNAGLSDGEVITAINGESTVGMSLKRAVSLIKGPQGTNVDLKILSNNGTHRDTSVVRGTVVFTGVKSRILEPNIGLLAISGFNKETPAKVRDSLIYFQQQKIKGLVLDLRNNKGGYFPAVKEITGMFTGPDQIMWYAQYTGKAENIPEKGTVQKMVQWPVVVLINSKTLCGGELLASAVKSTGGKLLGQKTFGEGTIYKFEKQPDGSSRKIPTGRFTTADGQIINGRGISPDRELDPKLSSEETLKQAADELQQNYKTVNEKIKI